MVIVSLHSLWHCLTSVWHLQAHFPVWMCFHPTGELFLLRVPSLLLILPSIWPLSDQRNPKQVSWTGEYIADVLQWCYKSDIMREKRKHKKMFENWENVGNCQPAFMGGRGNTITNCTVIWCPMINFGGSITKHIMRGRDYRLRN